MKNVADLPLCKSGRASHGSGRVPPHIASIIGNPGFKKTLKANGKVQAQKKVDVSATIAGQITHLAVKEGDRVKQGDPLVQLDARDYAAAYADERVGVVRERVAVERRVDRKSVV